MHIAKAHRHRNLFNADCNFLFMSVFPAMQAGERFDVSRMHRYVELLADSGVDTLLMGANAQVPWYPSRAVEGVLHGYRRGDRSFVRGTFPSTGPNFTDEQLDKALDRMVELLDRLLDLTDAGVDWLAEIAAACRRKGISPWTSVRMNDLHGSNSWERSFVNAPPQRDPRSRLSGRPLNPRHAPVYREMAMNYALPAVREYHLALIRELVEEYDYEGLELDWLRCAFCCEPPASEQTIETMTEWIGQIRQLTEARAARTGRPYRLGMRIPPRLGLLRQIGLDVPAMAQRGLIDFITPSNYWQTTWDVPHDELRRQLPETVSIYGCVEDAPNWMEALDPQTGRRGYRLLSASSALLRGNAASKLVLGADGIETYNFFCTDETRHRNPDPSRRQADYSGLAGLDDLENLRGRVKQYTLSSMRGGWMFPAFEYGEQMPQRLEPGDRRAFRIPACREPIDRGFRLVLQLVVRHPSEAELPDIGVSLNGSWPGFAARRTDQLLLPTGIYTHHVPEHRALNYDLDLAGLREGWNEILVFHGERSPDATPLRLEGLELAVLGPETPRSQWEMNR